ncbi:MAG: hypothetical protein AMS24_00540 [Chlamydiae bacterium SM23_39]|nr:MAG: hypothetical protein AMS24_00540 [Chlamydiae bacterium SM23_39]
MSLIFLFIDKLIFSTSWKRYPEDSCFKDLFSLTIFKKYKKFYKLSIFFIGKFLKINNNIKYGKNKFL